MKFSVLMPVYFGDKAEYVEEAIKSLLAQTLLPSEIVIIVDGKIGPDLEYVLGMFSREPDLIKVTYLEENKGLGDALNKGVHICAYEIIARMDADDICAENRFEVQMKYLEENPEVDVVGSFIHEFAHDPASEKVVREVPVHHRDIVRYSKRRNPMNHMTVIYRKSAVLKAGNYQKFIGFEDYHLWVRMIQKGATFHNIPDTLVYARTGDEMYKRRGGLQYLANDVKLQWGFLKSGFISFYRFLANIIARGLVRVAPNKIRSQVYTKFLRNHDN